MKTALWLRCSVIIAFALLVSARGAAVAAVPDRVQALFAGLADKPVAVERSAQADLDLAQARQDGPARYEAALRLTLAASHLEHHDLARRSAALVEREAQARQDAVALCVLAMTPAEHDDPRGEKALLRLQQAVDAAQSRGANWCVARLQAARGRILDRVVRLQESIEAFQDALTRFEDDRDMTSVASVQASLAWLYGRMDDSPQALERAIEYGELAVLGAENQGLRSLGAVARHNLAGPLLRANRTDEAHAQLRRALELAQEVEEPIGGAYIARLLARVEEKRGRPREALALFRQAQAVFAENRDLHMEVVCRFGAMFALADLGQWSELESELAAVEPLLKSGGSRTDAAHHHRLTMRTKEARGDLAGALAAAKAWAAELQASHREQNRRADAEARERHESARKEAENMRLRDQQQAAGTRQTLLLLTLALALALVAALAMHGVWQRRTRVRLRELAERDDLTQLPNRRAMLELAHRSIEEGRRLGRPTAVAVLDIDHFKSVNDRYGHDVGDAALRTFASVCMRTLRSHDRVGRIGGEEFLGIFPGATAADLGAVFERLRAALRDTPVPGMAPGEHLSFSMGAAFDRDADQLDALTRRADQALYESKALGRDRLSMAT